MQSWRTAPILLTSDGEGSFDVRGHMRLTARRWGGNANLNKDGDRANPTCEDAVGNGCHIVLGSIYDSEQKYFNNRIRMGTCMGPIRIGVQYDAKKNYCVSEYSDTTPVNGKMGLELVPDADNGEGSAGAKVSLWGKNAPLHIWSGEKDATQDEGHPLDTNCAIWLNGRPESGSTRIVGRKAISILLKKSPHEAIIEGDQGFAVDENQTTVTHKKVVRISGNNGNYNSHHMYFEGSQVGFRGDYAIPENQKNIYARFG